MADGDRRSIVRQGTPPRFDAASTHPPNLFGVKPIRFPPALADVEHRRRQSDGVARPIARPKGPRRQTSPLWPVAWDRRGRETRAERQLRAWAFADLVRHVLRQLFEKAMPAHFAHFEEYPRPQECTLLGADEISSLVGWQKTQR